MMKLLAYHCILSKCNINQICLNLPQKAPDNLYHVQLSNEELNYKSSVHIQ